MGIEIKSPNIYGLNLPWKKIKMYILFVTQNKQQIEIGREKEIKEVVLWPDWYKDIEGNFYSIHYKENKDE